MAAETASWIPVAIQLAIGCVTAGVVVQMTRDTREDVKTLREDHATTRETVSQHGERLAAVEMANGLRPTATFVRGAGAHV